MNANKPHLPAQSLGPISLHTDGHSPGQMRTFIPGAWPDESLLQSPWHNEAANPANAGVRFLRVLVPVDLSAGTLSILRRARDMAGPGAMLMVLHAVQLKIVGEERGIARSGLIRSLQEAARAKLGKFIDFAWTDETPTAVIIREGRPKDVIVQEAGASQADLIVMGAHSHAGWRRFLHNNTASHVMRHALCPVLVVRT